MSSVIIPTLKYENAPDAIEWLCKAFDFNKHIVVEGEPGKIAHAQLTFGNAMIMLSSARGNEFDNYQKTPKAVGGAGTQSPYIIISDVDSHHAKALDAGAKIVMQPEDQDYGGRAYSCLDPEGYLWNFGSYNPWE